MKKLIYANIHSKYKSYNDFFKRIYRLQTSNIVVTGALPLPRSHGSEFHEVVYPIPDPTGRSQLTFNDVTNSRVAEIAALAETHDLPIVAMYSGGIDSTCIVSALIKELPIHLRDRLHIKMTNASYSENPTFYRDVIQKYKLNTTTGEQFDYSNSMILHGDPADSLWLGGTILNFSSQYPGWWDKDIHEGYEPLHKYLASKSDDIFADWLYNQILSESESAGFKLERVIDFFWWLIFNYNFSTMCHKHIGEISDPASVNLESYYKNFVFWYASEDYQVWSIQSQQRGEKYTGTARSYKMPAKDYIYDLDGNQWYRDYKTKVHSIYTHCALKRSHITAIYTDGTFDWFDG